MRARSELWTKSGRDAASLSSSLARREQLRAGGQGVAGASLAKQVAQQREFRPDVVIEVAGESSGHDEFQRGVENSAEAAESGSDSMSDLYAQTRSNRK
jgi:hypothetical protein